MVHVLQEYGLPLDICLMIEKINYKEQFKLIYDELIEKINNDEIYKSHEWYFIQMLSFLRGINYHKPKFNDKLRYYIFFDEFDNDELDNDELDNDELDNNIYNNKINYNHYLLYIDHINIQLYQKKIYDIYHNYL